MALGGRLDAHDDRALESISALLCPVARDRAFGDPEHDVSTGGAPELTTLLAGPKERSDAHANPEHGAKSVLYEFSRGVRWLRC